MSTKSKIEWTNTTWNPVTGCDKISPGCKNCYAEAFAERFRGVKGHSFEQGFDLKLWPERLDMPLHWKKPRMVFVNSMSDLFHEDVPDSFIARVWWVMGQCAGLLDPSRARGHIFQILTKRPERARSWLNGWENHDTRREWIENLYGRGKGEVFDWMNGPEYWPDALPNVWLGVSVENQKAADERIPLLLQTPAAVRWVSAEPLLGPVNLFHWLPSKMWEGIGDAVGAPGMREVLDWLIIGGESGPKARPFNVDWARDLIRQCKTANVPVFMKQVGAKPVADIREWRTMPYTFTIDDAVPDGHGLHYIRLTDKKGGSPDEWPADLRVREFPG